MNAGSLLTLVLIGAVFYLLLIAPQRRRQRQLQQMTSTLEPGKQVMTTAGLFATVHAVVDDEVHLEIAPGVVCRYAKGAIARMVTPAEPDPDDLDSAHDGEPNEGEPPGDGTSTQGPGAPTEP